MALLRWIWGLRLRGSGTPAGVVFWLSWTALAALLVVLAPIQLLDGQPFWRISATGAAQALLAGGVFVALALFLGLTAFRPDGVRALWAVAGIGVCCSAGYAIQAYTREDLAHWTTEFGLGLVMSAVLALLPLLVRGIVRRLFLLILASSVGIVLSLGLKPEAFGMGQQHVLATELKYVSVSRFSNTIRRPAIDRGGALERFGDQFVLMTGDGHFYRLDWRDELTARQLPLQLTLDRLSALPAGERPAVAFELAAIDLLIDSRSRPPTLFVTHQHWDRTRKCFTLRVSSTVVDLESTGPPGPWKQVFETHPCLTITPAFQDIEAGGRLAWLGGDLLLTSGINGLGNPGQQADPQSPGNTYGKTLQLKLAGGAEVFTSGHRNPQGLFPDETGRIWQTEHGPQGGDEINLLEPGGNYGYPLATYGTQYGRRFWPFAPTARDHGEYVEPVFVFTPSIGISNLIRLRGREFPEWKDDLLVASLKSRSLFRVRFRNDRVTYVEQLFIGERIRDLAEGPDGRVLLWTDSGVLVGLGTASTEPNGEVVFERCRACHKPSGRTPLGPSIRGIVGARVAADSEYEYSPALKQVGGVWTDERLDAFLKDPNSFAPGSRMSPGQVVDDRERRALIEFLRRH